jgi:hypothetical protein
MKRLILIIIGSLVALSSCREKTGEQNSAQVAEPSAIPASNKTPGMSKQVTQQDYLAALQDICVEDDGVFKNCDELFGKDGSSYFFLIIPKAGAQTWYEAASKDLTGATYEKNNALSAKIQKIDKARLSEDFEVWVFYTDKKYTKHVSMDAAYNVINPHITQLYHLISGKNNWEQLDSVIVKNDSEVQKEIQWRDDFITQATQKSNQKTKTASVISAAPITWNGKYSTYFSYGDVAGQNAGWALEITITGGKITASGDGFQMAFADELSAQENSSELVLTHLKHISGYPTGQKMKPEFTLIKDNGKFYIQSKWINGDVVTKPTALGYPIDKATL